VFRGVLIPQAILYPGRLLFARDTSGLRVGHYTILTHRVTPQLDAMSVGDARRSDHRRLRGQRSDANACPFSLKLARMGA
jgi:hypothetical protein